MDLDDSNSELIENPNLPDSEDNPPDVVSEVDIKIEEIGEE